MLDETNDDGTMKFPCDASGRLDLRAITGKDPVLRQILQEGLEMEMLSYNIYTEEPYACVDISNALNFANQVALKATELAALSTLTGYVGKSAITDRLNHSAVKEGVRALVDEPDFIQMFDFVCRPGADKNSYIQSSLEFTSRFVPSGKRRLRLNTFTILSQTKAPPLSAVALCKRSLQKNPDGSLY